LNVHGINNARQTEIHTARPLVPEPNSLEVDITTEKLIRCKLPGTDQVLTELIQAGGNELYSESINLISLFEIWKNCHSSGRNISIYKNIDKTD
jgi:hypothetical protein